MTISPTATYKILDPEDLAAVEGALGEASPEARSIVDRVRGLLELQEPEAACLAIRLDAEPQVRDGLGNDPASSPAYGGLTDLAADCTRATTGAASFANSIQAQVGGALTNDQLTCLRDGYAALTRAEVEAIVQAGLTPESVDQSTVQTLDGLLARCQIDRATLPR